MRFRLRASRRAATPPGVAAFAPLTVVGEIERSVEELEEMVLEAGEESALGLRGLFEIAQCYEVAGDIGEAISWYTDTIDQITTALEESQEGNLDLSLEMQGFLFGMMQEVYVRAGETMAREGADGTAELFQNFRGHIESFGEEGVDIFDVVSESYGHLMLLAESRWKAESGDPEKVQAALAMTAGGEAGNVAQTPFNSESESGTTTADTAVKPVQAIGPLAGQNPVAPNHSQQNLN